MGESISAASASASQGISLHGPLRLSSDDRLARLAAKGDERAFAAIYERHHQGVYRYCRSILRNDEDARDALQNTMAKALDALRGETREIALKPWLYRIARNESISFIRGREPASAVEDIGELPDPRQAGEEARDRLRGLVADLAELPERQRSALVMRELTGLSYAEIAEALDSSSSAAKQSVYEAREALYQLEEGRAMECETARHSLSANDRRMLRGRRLRAHLKSCADCRAFQLGLRTRRADLAILAPPLPAAVAATVLSGVLGGGGGAAGGSGLIALITGAGGAGSSVGGSAAVKGAAAAAVTLVAGVGAYEVATNSGSGDRESNRDRAAVSAAPDAGAQRGSGSGESRQQTRGKDDGREGSGDGAGGGSGGKATVEGGAEAAPVGETGVPPTGGTDTGTGTGSGSGASESPSVTDTVTGEGGVADTVQDIVTNTTNGIQNTVDNITSQTGLDKLLPNK